MIIDYDHWPLAIDIRFETPLGTKGDEVWRIRQFGLGPSDTALLKNGMGVQCPSHTAHVNRAGQFKE